VAERALAAQTARIGQATAELFPKFELFGTIGWESLDEATLFSHDSLAWDFGPRFSWPIFHGGSILRNIEVQDALQEQLLARYKKTVLAAVKEVRDSLMAYAQEQERRDTLATGVEAAQAAVEIAQDKYRSGLTDFNNVLDAQRSLLSFQEDDEPHPPLQSARRWVAVARAEHRRQQPAGTHRGRTPHRCHRHLARQCLCREATHRPNTQLTHRKGRRTNGIRCLNAEAGDRRQ
jgi:hypothetical protein